VSVVERDEGKSQLSHRDELTSIEYKAIQDQEREKLVVYDSDRAEDGAWIESTVGVDRGEWR